MNFAKCIIVYSSVLNIDKVFIVNYELFTKMHSYFCHVAIKKTIGKGFLQSAPTTWNMNYFKGRPLRVEKKSF